MGVSRALGSIPAAPGFLKNIEYLLGSNISTISYFIIRRDISFFAGYELREQDKTKKIYKGQFGTILLTEKSMLSISNVCLFFVRE